MRGVVAEFAQHGLTEASYLKAALKQHPLLGLPPSTVAGNIRGVVAEFAQHGLTEADYLKAALKQPPLFCLLPSTVAGNVRGVVAEFSQYGLTEADYLKAAMKTPSLLTQSPATIAGNIRGVVAKFAPHGLTETDYLKAAMKTPPLFRLSPGTVAGHIELAGMLQERGAVRLNADLYGHPRSPADLRPVLTWLITAAPSHLTYSDDNFVLRMAHHELLGSIYPNVLTVQRHRIEREVAAALGHTDMKQAVRRDGYDPQAGYDHRQPEERHGALCRLVELGYLKSLRFAPS